MAISGVIVKPGAKSSEVAVQETLAETGVHCAPARTLGARVHPETSVYCEYYLCEYLAGEAANLDPTENRAATWIDVSRILRAISARAIYPPLMAALSLTSDFDEDKRV